MYKLLNKEVLKRIQARLNQESIVYSLIDKLDEQQKDALFLPSTGINLVRGCSGSGKSALSTLRAAYLSSEDAHDNSGKTLVLTRNAQFMSIVQNSLSTESLANIEVNSYRLLVTEDIKAYIAHQRGVTLEEIKKTTLQCTGKARTGLINSAIEEVKESYPEFTTLDIYSTCLEEIKIITLEGIFDSQAYLEHIQKRFIKPHEILDVDVDIESFYDFLFNIAYVYEQKLKDSKYAYDLHMMHYLWGALKPAFMSSSKYKHIIIDDANSVPSCVIKAIADNLEPSGSLTLFSDTLGFKAYPTFIESQAFLSRAHSAVLSNNYRSQVQLHKLAHVLAEANGQFSEDKEICCTQYRALKPKLIKAMSAADEAKKLCELSSIYQVSKSIAFLVNSSSDATQLSKMMPHAQKFNGVTQFELKMPKGIYIGSTLETKGLSFDVVCMPYMSAEKFDGHFSKDDVLLPLKTIYAGINCASEELYVIYSGKISKYLDGVLDYFELS